MKRKRQNSAVALKYRSDLDKAPKVVAKGEGKVAQRIITLAKEHQIHIHQDPDLIEVLSHLDLNQEIPPHVYAVVAEILAFVYTLNSGKNLR